MLFWPLSDSGMHWTSSILSPITRVVLNSSNVSRLAVETTSQAHSGHSRVPTICSIGKWSHRRNLHHPRMEMEQCYHTTLQTRARAGARSISRGVHLGRLG